MSIIYCLLHMGVRLGQRSILNRHAGRRRPRILEFGVQKKKFSHRAFSQLSPLTVHCWSPVSMSMGTLQYHGPVFHCKCHIFICCVNLNPESCHRGFCFHFILQLYVICPCESSHILGCFSVGYLLHSFISDSFICSWCLCLGSLEGHTSLHTCRGRWPAPRVLV